MSCRSPAVVNRHHALPCRGGMHHRAPSRVRGWSASCKPALAVGEKSYFGLFHPTSRDLLVCKVRVRTDLCRIRAAMQRQPFHSMHTISRVSFLHAAFCSHFPILRAGLVFFACLCGPQCLFCITAAGEVRQPSVSMGHVSRSTHVGLSLYLSPFAPL